MKAKYEKEYDKYGFDYETAKKRHDQLERTLYILQTRLDQLQSSYTKQIERLQQDDKRKKVEEWKVPEPIEIKGDIEEDVEIVQSSLEDMEKYSNELPEIKQEIDKITPVIDEHKQLEETKRKARETYGTKSRAFRSVTAKLAHFERKHDLYTLKRQLKELQERYELTQRVGGIMMHKMIINSLSKRLQKMNKN